ncbi:MAG: alpha-galactosidase [Candidatus Hydrogenedentes bacterium]|nr:alpha-galactosidase [Candidatus Hydrogenedentota bacterium]
MNRHGLPLGIPAGLPLILMTACQAAGAPPIDTPLFSISWPAQSVGSWTYLIKSTGEAIDLTLPAFEIDGKKTSIVLSHLAAAAAPVQLRNGATECLYEGPFQDDAGLHLQVRFRIAEDNPVVRFRYQLKASGAQTLTKRAECDNLCYLSCPMAGLAEAKEVRLAVFNEMIHSCAPAESALGESDFANRTSAVGPIVLGSSGHGTFLWAYEHDSMYTNRFLEFRLEPDRTVALCAVKGNYYDGQPADAYSTIWLEVAGTEGGEEALAARYRTFALDYLSENVESRKPYLYYNTWGRQERVKWRGGQYLTSMNLEYTLREIDRAHEMGLEFYVLDAGWFNRTGDWGVNLERFPDGFAEIRARLDGYGMKLGVWLNPAKAAVSSRALAEHRDCLKTWNGRAGSPSPEWETEDSVDMCLVSAYWETLANALIGMYRELGIRYFYLDGVGQSGCNDPGHFHGTPANDAQERADTYGFLLPVFLGRIIDKVSAACPDVVFDFDVTESRRIGVGLQFLASGRCFILNNGPYFHNFDLCPRRESILPNGCRNIFIHPGPARTWFMRSVLGYDKWIPANLFLANYQADDPANSQLINLASLMLGPNGVWGEILEVSPEGVARFRDVLDKYKQVRDDVTRAGPYCSGSPGDTPEIHEKINPETGRGAVVVFANAPGRFSYVTKNAVAASLWHSESATVTIGADGHAQVIAEFTEPSAAIVLFGTGMGE